MVSLITSLALVAGVLLPAVPAAAACDDLMPSATPPQAPRAITTQDLVRLRDIGDPDAESDDASPLALSPDRTQLAFVLARGDPQANQVCRALVVMAMDRSSPPRIVDRGGEVPIGKGIYRGLFVRSGYPEVTIPAWSPDGRWIAYLKRIDGVSQLWRARSDGGGAEPLLRLPVDIETFAWSPDGTRIVYTSRPAIVAGEQKTDREARTGFLYDGRAMPATGVRPHLRAEDLPLVASLLTVATGETRLATEVEGKWLAPNYVAVYPIDRTVDDPSGRRAWTEREGTNPMNPNRLWAARSDGTRIRCGLAACDGGILYMWWDQDMIAFLRREGWNREGTALYRWRPGAPRARRILLTNDYLSGCIRDAAEILCGRENATTPRRIVAISLRTGAARPIFDLNPEFASIRLGKVERLRVTNDRGLPAWADLVVPPGYDGRQRLPLVVVNYLSRGFLRGGVGNEYPIHLLAAKGFAVLSFQRPPHVAAAMPALRSWDEVNAAGRDNWAERRSILSALLKAVDLAIARGVADPGRLAISGLSDGASTVQFALLNSWRFAAAATSTCCEEPVSVMVHGGPAWHDYARRVQGYPAAIDHDVAFWKPLALGVSARTMNTPLLMQLADREYLDSLETFTELREAGKAVELYVYPDEYHNKWQPAHRLAIYDRNVDWFSFWLNRYEDPDPAKRDQYARWERLRAGLAMPADGLVAH